MFAAASQFAFGGDISGMVRAEPKTGVDSGATADGAYASRKYKLVERVDYSSMHDFVVYIDGLTVTNAIRNTAEVTTTKVAQHKAEFFPHVLPVMAGTKVEWPNSDDIFHNVFSDSDAHQFDLGLYKGNPKEKAQTFDRPGKVDVYCSIHANMHCIVLVLPNPYFAMTDLNGTYTITNVPPGKYKLKAWHERLPADALEIVVPTNGAVKADFILGVKNLPKY